MLATVHPVCATRHLSFITALAQPLTPTDHRLGKQMLDCIDHVTLQYTLHSIVRSLFFIISNDNLVEINTHTSIIYFRNVNTMDKLCQHHYIFISVCYQT